LNRLLAVFSLEPWPVPDIHLPIGISFFTFQAMSYLIDAARRNVAVQCNPLDFGLYIALFPQLVAGPIVRYRDVAAQIVRRMVTRDGLAYGIQRFIVGLAKKLVLADTLALRADGVFALRGDYLTTPAAWFGLACYTLQIYFDFSGYSDMAIGLGRMLGFKFRENFAYPYIARSITEFWRRWHISLSTWFRDYLYIPLGGNRRRPWIVGRNLITVFFLCGLWHGASWNFVLWGLYHGAFLLVERLARNRVPWAAPRFLQHAYALLVVMFGWVLFRADSLPHAGEFLAALCGLARGAGPAFEPALFLDPEIALVAAAGALGAAPCLPWLAARFRGLRRRLTGPARLLAEAAASAAAGLALGLLLLYAAMLMAAGTYSPFIYYRF
jgi:alginate O-acetyltransferase complex protein AlgI